MTTAQIIATIISALIGSGGIASAIVAFLSLKKYKAEAAILEQQADASRQTTEQDANEYVRNQLKELTETHRQESEELRRHNKELNDRVDELNNRINTLLTWIVVDNNSYRSWLENELRKLKPDIEFPECKPAPVFSNNN